MFKSTKIKAHTSTMGQAALEEGRAAFQFALAEFERHARLRGEYPQAYSHLFDPTVPPTEDKLRQEAHWKAATAVARRQAQELVTRVTDILQTD